VGFLAQILERVLAVHVDHVALDTGHEDILVVLGILGKSVDMVLLGILVVPGILVAPDILDKKDMLELGTMDKLGKGTKAEQVEQGSLVIRSLLYKQHCSIFLSIDNQKVSDDS
jgi:hypothetical protein